MGYLYLLGYILVIGVGTFLMKYGMKYLDAYQMNFLMAIGMLVITVPVLLITNKTLRIPKAGLAIGSVIGLAMALGSIFFVLAIGKLPAGLTAAIATAYVLVVVLLSVIILKESLDAVKLIGIILTVAGVALISLKS